jgi:ketosteroid isomerase-like protein
MKISAAGQRMPRLRALRWIRPCLWPGLLVAALVIAVFAESRAQPASGEQALVAAAATKLGDALRTGDKSAARKLLSLQFSFADENGKVFQRKEFLSDLKGVAASEAPTDVKVSVYGLVGMVTGSRKSAQGNPVFFLDIWAKQKGSWRALTMQDVMLDTGNSQTAADPPGGGEAKALTVSAAARPGECKNPCDTIPYRVRSPAEQEVIATLQEIAKATVARNADGWAKHIADDFMLYRTGHAPVTKAAALATIEHEKKSSTDGTISEVEAMRLAVYGDGAAMIANYVSADNSRPPYRAASVWTKRNGQWQLVIEIETDIKE